MLPRISSSQSRFLSLLFNSVGLINRHSQQCIEQLTFWGWNSMLCNQKGEKKHSQAASLCGISQNLINSCEKLYTWLLLILRVLGMYEHCIQSAKNCHFERASNFAYVNVNFYIIFLYM